MTLARPKDRVGRAYMQQRERLMKDSIRYTQAVLRFGPSTPSQRVSPEMANALARWLEDAEAALRRIEGLPRRLEGRDPAIRALKTLHSGLTQLAYSLQLTDASQAAATAATAQRELQQWSKLSADLERRLL